ncbi:hypothetical protein FHS29_003383 [Saccharothrix tamanrassetensis]|uniref:LSDAT prokaryote domain-containing protein n=1 Tax=Saccharothrix tamanrassetensis TaxID=1051531 RepID=A0A841CIE2_9PSEU|nr:hypothetical protein [Saccharothrix tamanrassetensis]MBB5956790.1 hypothetical protein [Saccharothrix tamanrassetensis]
MRVTSGAELPRERPVLVLVGGADGMADGHFERFALVLRELVPVLDALDAVVVDGGTDSGVMRAIGRARAACGGRFPLIGVVPGGVSATFEPNHTETVLVPGDRWGAEAPWLAEVAATVAGTRPSVTVLANGGQIAFEEAALSLARERPLVVVRGTGRTADAIADAVEPRAARISASPLTAVVPLAGLVTHLARVLEEGAG